MNKPRILLVEDDRNFGAVLKDYLMLQDFDITLEEDGEAGLEAFAAGDFQLCIFDVMMPRKDGFTLAAGIQKINDKVPFIFLTAKSLREDMIRGFRLGADDYMTKPFDSEVLLYKINAILNRHRKPAAEETKYLIGSVSFDPRLRKITTETAEHTLSPKEAALLTMLCVHRNEVLSRSKALKEIWKEDNYFTARSMDVYIAKLRKYLKDETSVSIDNLHGTGYSLITR